MLIYIYVNIYQGFIRFESILIIRYPLSKITHSSVLPYTLQKLCNINIKVNVLVVIIDYLI